MHYEGLMALRLRPGTPADAAECGRILYEAFRTIAEQHDFPPDFPSVEAATGVATMLLSHPGFHAVVAEQDGRVVGSNFLDERSMIVYLVRRFVLGRAHATPKDRVTNRAAASELASRAERRDAAEAAAMAE